MELKHFVKSTIIHYKKYLLIKYQEKHLTVHVTQF